MSEINILAVDTATEACSAALEINGEISHEFDVCPQQHSQRILPMVQELLTQQDASLSEIDVLAFGRGPGSFTGVRIATGMVQGLAFGAELPVVGVSTLAAMAQAVISQPEASQSAQVNRVAVAIDARMQEVYYGEFVNDNGIARCVGEERVISPEDALLKAQVFSPKQLAGTGWGAYTAFAAFIAPFDIQVIYPSALHMLSLAKYEYALNGGQTATDVSPVYLRDKVTWKKLPGKE